MDSIARVRIQKHDRNGTFDAEDTVAVEEPLAIYLDYGPSSKRSTRCVSVTMRTPGQDRLLGAGFLFTEGIIRDAGQIDAVIESGRGDNTVLLSMVESVIPQLQQADRNFYTTSSCGVCGKSSIEAIRTVSPFSLPPDELNVQPEVLLNLPDALRRQQAVFSSTGGLHAAGLFSTTGDFISLSEDVGRHNAVDKLIGGALLEERLPLTDVILLLSGRASFELVQKAAMAGIRIVAAVGAPSSLAVQLAEEQDITLIGFLRGERFNSYTHERRIRAAQAKATKISI